MNNKILLICTVLIVAMLGLSLTACGGDNVDYNGNVTLTFVFDEVYDDANVSCPQAKMTAVDNKTFKCELDSLKPVKIFATAKDKETQVFELSRDDLAKGDATINVSFKNQKYRVQFSLPVSNVPTIIGDSDVTIERVGTNKFELVSSAKINHDVSLDLGEEYFPLTIDAKTIVYSLGTYGRINGTFNLLKKSENKAYVYSTNGECRLRSVDGGGQEIFVNSYGVKVDIRDYYVQNNNGIIVDKMSKEVLKANPYYFINNGGFLMDVLSSYEISNIRGVNCDINNTWNNNTHNPMITSKNELKPGAIISLYMRPRNASRGGNYLYKITAEDIASRKMHLDETNCVKFNLDEPYNYSEYLGMYNIKLNVLDVNGNKVEGVGLKLYHYVDGVFKTTPIADGQKVNVDINPEYRNISVQTTTSDKSQYNIYNSYDLYEYCIYTSLMNNGTRDIEYNVVLDKSYSGKIKFVNVDDNNAPVGGSFPYNEFNYGNIYIPRDVVEGYRIVDKRVRDEQGNYSLIYDKDIFSEGDIVLEVSVERSVTVEITNREKLYDYNTNRISFSTPNNSIMLDIDKDSTEPITMKLTKNDLGRRIVLMVREYDAMSLGYSTISMIIEIPTEYPVDGIIYATIEDVKDEWGLGDNMKY